MTDHPHDVDDRTDDSIDARHANRTTPRDAGLDQEDQATGLGRRSFLKKTAAAGLAATTGLAASTESASADQKTVEVFSRGSGHQYYEIHMEGSNLSSGTPDVSYGSNAEQDGYLPDRITVEESDVGRYLDHVVVKGHVWNDGEDTFTYTGEVDYVVVEGDVAFYFHDRAFLAPGESSGHVYVDGLGSGKHEYTLASFSGDIDSFEDEPGDSDYGGSDTEKPDTYDAFNGDVWNHKRDSLSVSHGPMRYVALHGHARVWVRFES